MKLKHIIVIDHGPGMDRTTLRSWAEMANPATSAGSLAKRDPEPCHADGALGKSVLAQRRQDLYMARECARSQCRTTPPGTCSK